MDSDEASWISMASFRMPKETTIEDATQFQQKLENEFGVLPLLEKGLLVVLKHLSNTKPIKSKFQYYHYYFSIKSRITGQIELVPYTFGIN